jgi:hypothetical protein
MTPACWKRNTPTCSGLGDYRRGHALMHARRRPGGHAVESRCAPAHLPALGRPPFSPAPLLVSLENHVGEEIMVSSLLQNLVRIGQRALVEVDARFLALFARSFPALEFVDRRRAALGARFAAGGEFRRANSLDLAPCLTASACSPGTVGWLRADPARVTEFRRDYDARWPGKRRVGISWRSARPYNGIDAKSIALADPAGNAGNPGHGVHQPAVR